MKKPTPTPDDILHEIATSIYVTQISIQPKNKRFSALLDDPSFATKAQAIITEKLAQLKGPESPLPRQKSKQNILQGWEHALKTIADHKKPQSRER